MKTLTNIFVVVALIILCTVGVLAEVFGARRLDALCSSILLGRPASVPAYGTQREWLRDAAGIAFLLAAAILALILL